MECAVGKCIGGRCLYLDCNIRFTHRNFIQSFVGDERDGGHHQSSYTSRHHSQRNTSQPDSVPDRNGGTG